jgi:hypothetical protein
VAAHQRAAPCDGGRPTGELSQPLRGERCGRTRCGPGAGLERWRATACPASLHRASAPRRHKSQDRSSDRGAGTVTGEIFGLTNNSTSAASEVIIDSYPTFPSNPSNLGPAPINVTAWAYQIYNLFTESDGAITYDVFAASASSIAELRARLFGVPSVITPTPEVPTAKRKKFSAAARRKMALAQKARWAKIRGESETPAPSPPKPTKAKRKISEEGMKRIIAATKKRWRLARAAAKTKAAKTAPKKTAGRKKAAVKKTAPAPAPSVETAG